MSTIQVLPRAAGAAIRVYRTDAKQPTASVADRRPSTDDSMMYAWSIGVTEAATRDRDFNSREQECPPEVYIG